MKIIYDVRWKDKTVGEVYKNGDNLVYKPNIRNISLLEKDGMPSTFVTKKDNEDLPVFIKSRLKINPSNNNTVITDYFSIVRV